MMNDLIHLQAGDVLVLGRYAPESALADNLPPLPITWKVLKKEEERMLVLSEKVLDLQPFHQEETPVCWEDSDLRRWLNDVFLNRAFSREEQDVICQPEQSDDASDALVWMLFGAETTTDTIHDRVFLLHPDDVNAYWGEGTFHPGAEAEETEYVKSMEQGDHCYWLRSTMQQFPGALIVSPCASVGVSMFSETNVQGVRPAMWVKVK